jgi:putative ABC transport system permease protein
MPSWSTLQRLLHLSWRNIFRNRRRTVLTLGILMIGCAGMMVIGGLFMGITEGLRDQFIHSQTGHLQLNASGYYQFGSRAPLEYLIKDSEKIQREIESVEGVSYVVPRLRLAGMASSDKASVAVLAAGVDPLLERRMGSLKARNSKSSSIRIMEGRDLDPRNEDDAILGQGLIAALNLKVGDMVMFLTTREEGAVDGGPFRIVGTFQTFSKDADDRSMKINLSAAQKILGAKGALHSFQILLNDTNGTERVRAALVKHFENSKTSIEIHTWEELAEYYRQTRTLFDKIYQVILFVFCVVFFFSIGNTVTMALLERVREFGTMMAMGNSRGTILAVILMESVFLGLIGGGGGVALGWLSAHLISSSGIEMMPPQGVEPHLVMIILTPKLFIQAFLLALVASVTSAFLPAYRTIKLKVVEALGHV